MGKYETRDQQYIRLFSPSSDNLWIYHSTLKDESNLAGFRNVIDNYFNNIQLGANQISLEQQQKRIVKILKKMAQHEFSKEIAFLEHFVDQETINRWKDTSLGNKELGEIVDQLNNLLNHSKIYQEHKKVFKDTAKKIKTYSDKSDKIIYQNISAALGSLYYECFLKTWEEILTPNTKLHENLIEIMIEAGYNPTKQDSQIDMSIIIDKIIGYISIKTLQEFFFDNKSYYNNFLKEIYPDLDKIEDSLITLDNAINLLQKFEHSDFQLIMQEYRNLQAVSPFMEAFQKTTIKNFNDFAKVSQKTIKEKYTFKSTRKPGAIEGQKGSLGGTFFELLSTLFENVQFSKAEQQKLKSYFMRSTQFSNDTITIFNPSEKNFKDAADKAQNFTNITEGIKGKSDAAQRFVDFSNTLPKGTFLIVQSMKYPYIEKLTAKIDIKGTARSGVEVDAILDEAFQDSSGKKRQQYFHMLIHYIYNQLYFPNGVENLGVIANATYNIVPLLGRLIFDEFEILGREEQKTTTSNMLFLFSMGGIKIPVSHLLILLAKAFEDKSPLAALGVSHIKAEGKKPGYSQFRLLQNDLELHFSLYINPLITPPLSTDDEPTLIRRWQDQQENFIYDRKLETNFFHSFNKYLKEVLKDVT